MRLILSADDGLVACPICLTRMKPWQVDRHIDTTCPGSPQPKNASSATGGSSFGSNRMSFQNPPTPTKSQRQPDRLPALAYSMLKDTMLRKKMAELGLSTVGTRQMLERRHQEWVTIWNANCDSARPKRRSELLHDLDVWERTMGSRAPATSRAATMGAQIKDKDFDGNAWATKYDSSFKDLIAKARGSKNKAAQKVAEDLTRDGSDQEGGNGVVDSAGQPLPGQPHAEPPVIDLTESMHSPVESGVPAQASTFGGQGNAGTGLGHEAMPVPQTVPIQNYGSFTEPNGAP